jgi:hypothetical protein
MRLSQAITHPADLLGPAHDLRLLRPQGFATGLVASLCPGRTSTSWIAKTNFRGGLTRMALPVVRQGVTTTAHHREEGRRPVRCESARHRRVWACEFLMRAREAQHGVP